ncbi:MAG: heavy metal translocating P-type ATPase [Alphaproteobacteria bacterium]
MMDMLPVAAPGVGDPAEPVSSAAARAAAHQRDYQPFVDIEDADTCALYLLAQCVYCGGCVNKIERALAATPNVVSARVNLSTRRLVVRWRGAPREAVRLVAVVESLGFKATPYQSARLAGLDAKAERQLLRCLAVAGFAAANVMLLSVAVWAGHAEAMDEATRQLLHWFSALIALPALAYAGQPFFRSAWNALSHRRTNMDVPISIGVTLAAGMSLWETVHGGPHAYFDSAITLVFFLLVGRYLDHRARGRARSAAEQLVLLGAITATRLDPSGAHTIVAADRVQVGDRLFVASGDRIPADGKVVDGVSDVDNSLISGESLPIPVRAGDRVFAGTINVAAPLTVEVTAIGRRTLLSEIVGLMELAEQRRAKHVVLADRVSRYYAPVVHLLALLTFVGWMALGQAWQPALLSAVAVLIITCPCALGLAVPAVQVIASGRLMRGGTLMKSATALERLAKVDTVVFDKTGTLTLGRPELVDADRADVAALRIAAGLAMSSKHPLARALARAVPDATPLKHAKEAPGYGLAATTADGELRLGSRSWCGVSDDAAAAPHPGSEIWLARPGCEAVRFRFNDRLRADARQVIDALRARGKAIYLLSGDREAPVKEAAAALGIEAWHAGRTPAEKIRVLESLAADGRSVLMVGDGLNDAPALAAAYVSMSPSTAIDISQTAADVIFQGDRLAGVAGVLDVARRADRLVKQNFALALTYNALTIPIAMAGLVTPLIAAAAMSASSILVVGNALRLNRSKTS